MKLTYTGKAAINPVSGSWKPGETRDVTDIRAGELMTEFQGVWSIGEQSKPVPTKAGKAKEADDE